MVIVCRRASVPWRRTRDDMWPRIDLNGLIAVHRAAVDRECGVRYGWHDGDRRELPVHLGDDLFDLRTNVGLGIARGQKLLQFVDRSAVVPERAVCQAEVLERYRRPRQEPIAPLRMRPRRRSNGADPRRVSTPLKELSSPAHRSGWRFWLARTAGERANARTVGAIAAGELGVALDAEVARIVWALFGSV